MSGGTLVLLHGLASNSTRWWRFPPALGDWRVVKPDLRGYAGSHERGRVGIEPWCRDLAARLDLEGAARAVIAGHCLGASVALHFAARYPQRTAGLILIEPMPRQALVGSMSTLFKFRFLLKGLALAARTANALGLKRSRIEPMDLEKLDQAAASGEVPLSDFASPLADLESVPTAAYLQSVLALFEPLPPLAGIRCPVLAMLSRKSTMTDVPRTREILRELPDAEVLDMPAEHWIPTECPAELRAAIEAWLARR